MDEDKPRYRVPARRVTIVNVSGAAQIFSTHAVRDALEPFIKRGFYEIRAMARSGDNRKFLVIH